MANHIKPNDPDYNDTSEDLLLSCRIMARSLGFLLRQRGNDPSEENEGIIIQLDGKRYIVSNNSETNQIDVTEEHSLSEYPEGSLFWIH